MCKNKITRFFGYLIFPDVSFFVILYRILFKMQLRLPIRQTGNISQSDFVAINYFKRGENAYVQKLIWL